MPIIEIHTEAWSLSVWTRDAEAPLSRLTETLRIRGGYLPDSIVRFSPSLAVSRTVPPMELSEGKYPELKFPALFFFENRLYEFDFRFNGDTKHIVPRILHWSPDVINAFHCVGNSLRGSVNFGNDVGWFRLGIEFEGFRQYISFEVLPIKMDLIGDLSIIHKDIDTEYPLWRFSFAKKTELEMSSARKPHERFPLLWLALFRNLISDLQKAVKLVCSAPHSRLLPQEKYWRSDRLKQRLPHRLEEKIARQIFTGEIHRRHLVEFRYLSIDTPENRFVKMVVTRCARELSGLAEKARRVNEAPEGQRISQAFFNELDRWKEPLEQNLAKPFFREVGLYSGIAGESLVLHHKAGYARIYRIWQELKLYLDLFGKQASISVKTVAELYEVWCVLEIRRMLCSLGFQELASRKTRLKNKNLEKDLMDGFGTAFSFERSDGLKISLAHEPLFKKNFKKARTGIISWTTPQQPDILLEAIFIDGTRIRWIFDAKYRIDANGEQQDLIPDDAINQMHRYRDALIYYSSHDDAKSRPIVGAFVLYPGYYDESSINPYSESIDAVGIGGFPLLPNRPNLWLKNFLAEKFGFLSESNSYSEVPDADEHLLQESVRIPPTGLSMHRYPDLTLAAMVVDRGSEYLGRFRNGQARWYHMRIDGNIPEREIMDEVRYCAFSVHYEKDQPRRIEYIYDIDSFKVVKRSELTQEQAGKEEPLNNELYILFELGSARRLDRPVIVPYSRRFRYRLTGKADLIRSTEWAELPDRYKSLNPKQSLN